MPFAQTLLPIALDTLRFKMTAFGEIEHILGLDILLSTHITYHDIERRSAGCVGVNTWFNGSKRRFLARATPCG